MKLKILLSILIFCLGLITGQKLMYMAYDPATLEANVLRHIRIVYATGCSEGIRTVTGRDQTFVLCLDLAEKTVKDQEDFFRSKMWEK